MAIEWRTVLMALPRRRFTAAELQRAIPDPPSPSLKLAVALNMLLPVAAFTWGFGGPHRWALGAVMLAIGVLLTLAMARAWGNPGHRFARWTYFSLPLVLGLGLGLVIRSIEGVQQMEVMAVALVAVIGSLALWFAIVYRHQFIERRLVENAIEHGATPSLSAVQVHVQARRHGTRLVLEVRDTGVGLAPDATDGVGLGNARARLVQAFGDQASLTLQRPPQGGCLARIECPLSSGTPIRYWRLDLCL